MFASEQPCEELTCEERESTAECDAGDLAFRSTFAKHEHQSTDNDGDERQRSRERTCEGRFKVQRGAFPGALRTHCDRSREDRTSLVLRLQAELRRDLPDGPSGLPAEVLERLVTYNWPGNVREMRNVLERALILGRGLPQVAIEHLPGEFRNRPGIGDRRHAPMTLDELERQHIERTLRHHNGNRTRAAHELGISRATLINKIKRYAINV